MGFLNVNTHTILPFILNFNRKMKKYAHFFKNIQKYVDKYSSGLYNYAKMVGGTKYD